MPSKAQTKYRESEKGLICWLFRHLKMIHYVPRKRVWVCAFVDIFRHLFRIFEPSAELSKHTLACFASAANPSVDQTSLPASSPPFLYTP